MTAGRILVIAFVFLAQSVCLFAEGRYKKYTRTRSEDYFMRIALHNGKMMFAFNDDAEEEVVFNEIDITRKAGEVLIKNVIILGKDGFTFKDKVYPREMIDRVSVVLDDNEDVQVFFRAPQKERDEKFRRRRSNEVAIINELRINANRFIRGSVVGLWSDLYIEGEVNEDVIAVFGNIEIGDHAIIRGDVVALNGRISASRKATIYGEVLSSGFKKKHRFDRWRSWYRRESYVGVIGRFYYNRVDGAAPYFGLKFVDEDSLLPAVEVYGSYAFTSERWRYHLGVEQSFLLSRPLTAGGSVYQRLASSDDWLIGEDENTGFALLATEDYKDYYEAQGVYGFLRWAPFPGNSYELGIRSERHRWLDGHVNLWSLFGGSKRFPQNFMSLNSEARARAVNEIDRQNLTALSGRISLCIDNAEEELTRSFWDAFAEIEWSPDDWNSDFDFTRYLVSVARYQKLNAYTGLYFQGVYGGSDGVLPVHRKFFLGGLGTLHGYRHKEYMGTEFWLTDLQYRINFPNTDFAGWLFYGVGRIGDGPDKLADAEIKHSLGIGLSFGTDLRVNIAQRLDRAGASPRIYVRLGYIL
ncbi:MAG: BamA/TamA family outer membrane protein [Candidatus Zixiibacteriota bacterium]|nr:MAG: BamA/TamA family outer membrane protein [candidate division Zixibacteria bacterium]